MGAIAARTSSALALWAAASAASVLAGSLPASPRPSPPISGAVQGAWSRSAATTASRRWNSETRSGCGGSSRCLTTRKSSQARRYRPAAPSDAAASALAGARAAAATWLSSRSCVRGLAMCH